MKHRYRILLLLALAGSGIAAAQTPPADQAEPEAPAEAAEAAAEEEIAETAPADAVEELPDIDVWAEDAADDSDVFIPTERISADASIAFPADI